MFLAGVPVAISLSTIVIELFIFLAMVLLMERFVFNPIRGAWAERDRRIQEGLMASNEGREEAEEARAEVRRLLQAARLQAQQDIDGATREGTRLRDELVANAAAEFRRLVEEAQTHITVERERTAGQLGERIVDLALLAASRVTGQKYAEPRVRELAAAVVSQEGLK